MVDAESSQEEDGGNVGEKFVKKVGKKKHYPFGTASHANPPFSEYAHLPVDTRSFALGLSTSGSIKPEVIEDEEPKKKRHGAINLSKTKHKKSGDTDHDEDDDDESLGKTEGSSLGPCTKIPCQMVIRAITDIQFKNEVEKLDLEDEYEKLVTDLHSYEHDLQQSEQRLDKMSDFSNQLEVKLNQIMSKVEQYEKTKEHLQQERTEINSKLMLIEIERQKANRRLDKASKQLSGARWRKKKQSQMQDVESGLTLPASAISENKILHADDATIQKQLNIYQTPLSRLAKEKDVDIVEKPAPVKTVPGFLQEKFFNKPEAFDKYSKDYYEKSFHHSLDSWKHTEGTVVAHSTQSVAILHPSDPSSKRFFQKKLQQDNNTGFGGVAGGGGGLDDFSHSFAPGGDDRLFGGNSRSSPLSPKSFNVSSSLSSLGLNSLTNSASLSRDMTGRLKRQQIATRANSNHNTRLPPRQDAKTKSLTILDSVHSLIQLNEGKLFDDNASVRSGNSSQADSRSMDYSYSRPVSHQSTIPPSSSPQHSRNHANGKKKNDTSLASLSILQQRQPTVKTSSSGITTMPGVQPWDLSSQTANSSLNDPEKMNEYLDMLQEAGIFLGEGGLPLQNPHVFDSSTCLFLFLIPFLTEFLF
jgi:outer membrane murein-binding lipoprotein Lpp